MSDTIFKTATEATNQPEADLVAKQPTRSGEINIEVPYLDYEADKGHPYAVDHYQLGERWALASNEGGFNEEVSTIESYIESKIKSGEIANSLSAVKNLLKSLEKVTNISKEERAVIKVETLSAYVEFLMKTDKLKYSIRRYGN